MEMYAMAQLSTFTAFRYRLSVGREIVSLLPARLHHDGKYPGTQELSGDHPPLAFGMYAVGGKGSNLKT
jgi:hypothetical protein